MQRFMLFLVLTFCLSLIGLSQNIVPNPSFEKVKKIPNRWMSNHSIFEDLMDEWTTPNLGSPDILFDELMDKIGPPRKGVDLSPHRPRTGKMMTAIKTYGCATYTQHCKEYLQIKLTERIEKGEEYYVEFWVNAMSTSLYTNNIGLAFSDVEIQDDSEYGIYYFDPVVNEKAVVSNGPNDWHKIAGTVKADNNYNYIIVGNFFTDDETEIIQEDDDISYSYYLIDDVIVKPLNGWGNILETKKAIRLENVLFESGKAELLPSSFSELDKLYDLLHDNPTMVIQINGHTDNQGEALDNKDLSKRRALAVVEYLKEKGIGKERMPYNGFGESKPIASNGTVEGQQLNRRVEFVIFSK